MIFFKKNKNRKISTLNLKLKMAKNMKGLFPKDLLKDHSGDSDDEEDEDVKRMKQGTKKENSKIKKFNSYF